MFVFSGTPYCGNYKMHVKRQFLYYHLYPVFEGILPGFDPISNWNWISIISVSILTSSVVNPLSHGILQMRKAGISARSLPITTTVTCARGRVSKGFTISTAVFYFCQHSISQAESNYTIVFTVIFCLAHDRFRTFNYADSLITLLVMGQWLTIRWMSWLAWCLGFCFDVLYAVFDL